LPSCLDAGVERPPSVAVALGFDQLNLLSHAIVRRGADLAQVLKIPQHIVVPPRWEGESDPGRINHLTSCQPPEEAALEKVLLPA